MDRDVAGTFADVVVVGAGPAGLAVGACLRRAGIDFVMLERERELASSWRRHYDRLHLHTDRRHSGLPHLPMPGTYPRFPSRQQVVDYLESYAKAFSLTPRLGEEVLGARPHDGGWEVETASARLRCRALVLATGCSAEPVRPRWPGVEGYRGALLHAAEYRSGEPFRGQDVLVVGFGNSGGEIAVDLHEHGARPRIVVRGPVNLLPRELLGMPVVTWALLLSRLPPRLADLIAAPLLRLTFGDLSRLGLRKAPVGPMRQIRERSRIPLIDVGTVDLIRRGSVGVRPGVREFTGDGVIFEDGSREGFDAVVLATGYQHGLSRIVDDPTLPGLHLCGFHVASTGMLREIGLEAARIAEDLSRRPPQ